MGVDAVRFMWSWQTLPSSRTAEQTIALKGSTYIKSAFYIWALPVLRGVRGVRMFARMVADVKGVLFIIGRILYFSVPWMLKYMFVWSLIITNSQRSVQRWFSWANNYASIRKSCIGSNCERSWVTYNNLKLGYLHNVTLYWHHCFALLHLKEFLRKPSKTTLRFFSRGGVTSQFC